LLYSIPSVSDLRVDPLVQSKWGQGYEGTQLCYNYFTNFGTSYYYLSGCVATALAQILRHYSLPADPVGMTRFDIRINNNLTYAWLRGGDDYGGVYDWNNMVLDPNAFTPDLQRQAIGRLTHDAGVAVHTSYATSGSGAYTQNVAIALTSTFGFANARYGYNGNYTIPSANLNNMINTNLDARFPAILGIIDTGGNGHEVIVDGYGYNISTLYHHLNLGWSGTDDAWYNLPTISTSTYNFNAVIETVYNIFPQGSGEIISGRVLNATGQPVGDVTITATSTGGSYTTASNSQGIYALAKIPAATTYTISASKDGYVFFPKIVKTGTSLNGNNTTGNLWGIDFVENLAELTLSQALDNNDLAFVTGGDVNWSGQTAVSFTGGSSAQTGAMGNNQTSWLQTTVVGPGTLSFYWKVSSEETFDFLEVFLDEVLQPGAISGEVDWQRQTISIPAGSHIVKWTYSKDNAISMGSDCGWVDKVSFRAFRRAYLVPGLKLLLIDE
jgi:hypothetical protein